MVAFWVAEFVTVGSLVIVYCWMSWGPVVLIGRRFIVPRKGLVLEFIIYTYIIFIAFITKLATR